ncbi:MBL fold metallo-hydrolase [Runella sp.]|jgi:glyoxylase-like metal-dependent hydrolase (beta-lactamase superfamily II)|uniref:MBL fold metallo-hydrolase n=1 Tax=Runella sp. TaxID=1960881 RepID=UPI002617AF65|nr:MBL fold metallo-hydrolase [Runella sp.]
MQKQFASVSDLEEKQITFTEIAPNIYAYTTQGDPNSAVIIGDDHVLVMEAQATPVMAKALIEKIRTVTDKPIKYLILSHYHAVRVLGASAFEGAEIICSTKTLEMINERGEQDFKSETDRFPRLFRSVESIPHLTYPTITFETAMTINLGNRIVELKHLGAGHTRGDIVAWVPDCKALFSGDLLEYGATPYCGDAQLEEWPQTLQHIKALGAVCAVPGRGNALFNEKEVNESIDSTTKYVTMLLETAKAAVAKGLDLTEAYKEIHGLMKPIFGDYVIFEHCMPFNVTRAYEEAQGIKHPKIWTAEKDKEMWFALQASI